MGFSKFMASTAGRAAQVIAGVALIVVGGLLSGGWWALAVVGRIPIDGSIERWPVREVMA